MATMEFNEQQLMAINSSAKNILLVAGPGSGKTTVIIERIVRLIKEGASPYEFLVITFTRKAAEQLKERLTKAFEGTDINVKKMTICTSHAFCLRIIQQWAEKIGYNENVVIYDEIDQKDIVTEIINEMGYKISPTKMIEQIKVIMEGGKENIDNSETLSIYNTYLYQLQQWNALDYDLILLKAVYLLRDPEVLQYYQNRYRYLFYDEFQDIATLENELCLSIAIENSFVVGDISQNIYSWRGTDIKFFLNYQDNHPNCEVLKLEYNYRSRPCICEAANNLIKHNSQRADTKMIPTRKPDILDYIGKIHRQTEIATIEYIGRCPYFQIMSKIDIAILVRTNNQIETIRKQLELAGIPVQVVTRNLFWQKPEIKDILSFMEIILNPKDDFSMNRILKMPFMKLTDRQILEFKKEAIKNDKTLFEVCQGILFDMSLLNSTSSVLEVYKTIIDNLDYIEYLKAQKLTSRIESVLSMESLLRKFEEESDDKSLRAFLESISLTSAIDSWDEKKEAVSLMTIHCAKGLEWDIVFIVGCMEGLMPLPCKDDMAMEEERRLFYVGMTRAKEQLFLAWWDMRQLYGRMEVTEPSRFLEESKS